MSIETRDEVEAFLAGLARLNPGEEGFCQLALL